jgi:hypothetical protein
MNTATADPAAVLTWRPVIEAYRAYVESDEGRADQEAERALVELMAEMRDLPDEERVDTLRWWVRSPYWSGLLLILSGWQGKLAREAYRILVRDREAECPGKRWNGLDWKVGRASIARLLGVVDSPWRVYASAPFRTWVDDAGRGWIAGAIGSPPLLDAAALEAWEHMDITAVILWDPRTNEAQLAGEDRSYAGYLLPPTGALEPRLTVWGDPGAFFRAWAAKRARKAQFVQADRGANPCVEFAGADLPGGLLIGSSLRARWPQVQASTVAAGPGLTRTELHAAAYRAARLPSFEGE